MVILGYSRVIGCSVLGFLKLYCTCNVTFAAFDDHNNVFTSNGHNNVFTSNREIEIPLAQVSGNKCKLSV